MEKYTETYHAILAKSYITFFLAATVGLFLETFFPLHVTILFATPIAIICFVVGPALILWAQYTSRHTAKQGVAEVKKQYFGRGPYRYLRNPTQLGLIILFFGYAVITSSFTFFLATFVAYLISNYFFRKYEMLLKKEFGDQYLEYQNRVKKVL